LWQAIYQLIEHKQLAARALGALENFVRLIETLGSEIRDLELYEQIEQAIQASGLIAHYEKEKGERGQARIENLEELVSAGRDFTPEPVEDGEPEVMPLDAFLAEAALEAGERQANEWDDCIQLMTLHSAKGLEFKQVFMCGMEEGLFPHRLSVEEPGRLEEERRLCYVGMTRAMEQLTLSYAEKRRLYGEEHYAKPSRFLKEIPAELLEEERLTGIVTPAADYRVSAVSTRNDESGFTLGQRVCHETFGEGVVLNYEGEGRHARVQINFESAGSKWLMVEYANLITC
jgi:DNA helicase-2/ATP-dependent DNA helicase PcrA